MGFQEEYKQKLVTADEAVKVVQSGDWVDYGWCTGTPDVLDKALAKRTDELKDIKNYKGAERDDYIENIAREDLNYLKNGERVFINVSGN